MEAIHPRGYWLDKSATDTHMFDPVLCDAIVRSFTDMKTIIDIGCGNGKYTSALNEAGYLCLGFDGSPLTPELTNMRCDVMDFSQSVNIGKFDLVLSLEVGEHIPVEYEQTFIDNLCNHSKKSILISWAVEGQPGTGHVNCRNNDYIISEMKKRDFIFDEDISQYFRDNSYLPWFKNTLMYFEYEN